MNRQLTHVIATQSLDRSTTHRGDPEPLEMTGFSPRRVAEVTRFRENDDFYRDADFLDKLHIPIFKTKLFIVKY